MLVINGENHILGRLACKVAKKLIEGEEVVIVNAEKIIITGRREAIIARYKKMREVGSSRKGPYYPRMPDRIVRRAVRGMLPYQKPSGRVAFKRLKVYIGIPQEYAKENFNTIENATKITTAKHMRIEELSKILGAKF